MNGVAVAVAVLDLTVIYLLQMGAAKLYGRRCHHFRFLIGSLVPAIHSGAVASGMLLCMDSYAARTVILTVAGVIAFGCRRDGIWKTALFLLLDAALDGIVNGHHLTSAFQRISVAAVIVLLCANLRQTGRAGESYAHIEVQFEGRTMCVDAFRDTGNGLKDIVTGAPVLVIGPDAAYRLTGLQKEELSSPLETMEKRPINGLRLIPYSSVGESHGLMLGVLSRDTVVDGIPTEMVIAMAPEGMGMYEALIGGDHDTWDHQKAVKKVRIRRGIAPLHRRHGHTTFSAEGERRTGRAGSTRARG